jgi:hypothetical protein
MRHNWQRWKEKADGLDEAEKRLAAMTAERDELKQQIQGVKLVVEAAQYFMIDLGYLDLWQEYLRTPYADTDINKTWDELSAENIQIAKVAISATAKLRKDAASLT